MMSNEKVSKNYKNEICKHVTGLTDTEIMSLLNSFRNDNLATTLSSDLRQYIDGFDNVVLFVEDLPDELFPHFKPMRTAYGNPATELKQQDDYLDQPDRSTKPLSSDDSPKSPIVNIARGLLGFLYPSMPPREALVKLLSGIPADGEVDTLQYISSHFDTIKCVIKEFFFKDDEKIKGLFSFLYSLFGIDYNRLLEYIAKIDTVIMDASGKYKFNRDHVIKNILILTQVMMEQLEAMSINVGPLLGTIYTYFILYYVIAYTTEYAGDEAEIQRKLKYKQFYLQMFASIFLKMFTVWKGFHVKGYRGHTFLEDSSLLFMLEILHPTFYNLPNNYYSTSHAIYKQDVYQSCYDLQNKIIQFGKNMKQFMGRIPWLSENLVTGFCIPRVNKFMDMRMMEIIDALEQMEKPDLTVRFSLNSNEHGKKITKGAELHRGVSVRELYHNSSGYNFEDKPFMDGSQFAEFTDTGRIHKGRRSAEVDDNNEYYSDLVFSYNRSPLKSSLERSSINSAIEIIDPYFPEGRTTFSEKYKKRKVDDLVQKIQRRQLPNDNRNQLYVKMCETLARSKGGRDFLETVKFEEDDSQKKIDIDLKRITPSDRKSRCTWPSDYEIESAKKHILVGYEKKYDDMVKYLSKRFPSVFSHAKDMVVQEQFQSNKQQHLRQHTRMTTYDRNVAFKNILDYITGSVDIDSYDGRMRHELVERKVNEISQSEDFRRFIRDYYKPSSKEEYPICILKFKQLALEYIGKYKKKSSALKQLIEGFIRSKKYRPFIYDTNVTSKELKQHCRKFVSEQITPEWISRHYEKKDISKRDDIIADFTEQIVKDVRKPSSSSSFSKLSTPLEDVLSDLLSSI